jgi:fatty acid desaturase
MPAVLTDAGRAYAELRESVLAAGLLDRARGYYVWRGGLSFLLLAVSVVAALALPPWPGAMLLVSLLMAFGSVQVALIGHDAGHLAVCRSPRANWVLGSLCWSLTLGIGFWYWHDRHTRHHASTNDLVADPDLQWAGLVAYSEDIARARPRRASWLLRYQAVLGPAYTLTLAFAFRVEGWTFAFRHLRGRRRLVEVALLVSSALVWLWPTVVLDWAWLVTFGLAQVLAGLYLALAIAPNHKGMPIWPAGTPLTFVDRQVLSSRNLPPHLLTDFVFGGLNYQIEHHLFPSMPRAHFRRARAIVQPFCGARGLPYQEMGVFASYRLVLSELRRVGATAAEVG